VAAAGVLGNDTDAESDALTAELVADAEHGDVTLAADGSFTYTPERDFNGTDTFRYRASDGGLQSDPATVTIAVAPVDDPAPVDEPTPTPTPKPPAVTPSGSTPPPPVQASERAISRLRLASRCVRRSASGRVRVPMTMRLAEPGALQIRIDRAVGSKGRSTCPRASRPVNRRNTPFQPVTTVRPASAEASAAALTRRVVLKLRLTPGLYRISVRVRMDDNRLSRPVRRFLRVVG
jgi:large repetitive protein